jgi:hypothetical protein
LQSRSQLSQTASRWTATATVSWLLHNHLAVCIGGKLAYGKHRGVHASCAAAMIMDCRGL